MRILTNIADGLRNVVANLGTARQGRAHSVRRYNVRSARLLTTYAVSWVARGVDTRRFCCVNGRGAPGA